MGRCSWIIPVTFVLFLVRCRCLEELLESSLPFPLLSDTQHVSNSTTSSTETLSPYRTPYKASISPTLSLTPEILYDKVTTTSSSTPHILESAPKEWTKYTLSQYKELISPTLSITSTYGKHSIDFNSILHQLDSTLGISTVYTPQHYKEQMAFTTSKISESMDKIRTVTLKFISDRIVDTTLSLWSTDLQTQYKESTIPTISKTSDITEQAIRELIPQKSITTQTLQTTDQLSQYMDLKSNTFIATTKSIYAEDMVTLNSTGQNRTMSPDKSSSRYLTSKFKQSKSDTETKITAEAWMITTHNVSAQPITTESSNLPILTSSIIREDMSKKDQGLELSLSTRNYSKISPVYDTISENTKTAVSSSLFLMSKNNASLPPSIQSLIQTSPSLSKEKIHHEIQTVKLLSGFSLDFDSSHETLMPITISSLYNLLSPSKTQMKEKEFSPEVTGHAQSILMPSFSYNLRSKAHYEAQEKIDDPKTLINKIMTTHKDEKVILTSSNTLLNQFNLDTPKVSYAHVIETSFDIKSKFLPDVTSSPETKASYSGLMKKEKVVEFKEQDNSNFSAVSSEYVESEETVSSRPSSEPFILKRNNNVFTLTRTNFTENNESIKISSVENKSSNTNQNDINTIQEKRSSSEIFKTDLPYHTYVDDFGKESPSQFYRSSTTPYFTLQQIFSIIESSTKYGSYSFSFQPIEENFNITSTPSYDGLKPDSQKLSERKETQARNEKQSENKIMSTKIISNSDYTHATHELSGSETEYIDVQYFISLPSLLFIDSDHQSGSTFNSDTFNENFNEEKSTLSFDLHTTKALEMMSSNQLLNDSKPISSSNDQESTKSIVASSEPKFEVFHSLRTDTVENYKKVSSNQLLNDSKSLATINEQESTESIVASSEPTFEIFHSVSNKIISQEIASKLEQESVNSQQETSYSSSLLSQQPTSQPELQSSFTLVQDGSRFWTTNTEPLLTVSDKIDGALLTSSLYTREKALDASSKQTKNQIRSFFSHAFSSLNNQTHTMSSAQSEMHTAWFENNVSLNKFNTSQHKSWNNDKENQSKSEYFTFLSHQNLSISNLATSSQFRFGDVMTSLIHPTPSPGYDSHTTQPSILSKLSFNNAVVQVETSDESNNKNLTYKIPTPSSDYVSAESHTIVMPSDMKTLASDNERKNFVQTSESSDTLYSTMENQYENSFLSSMYYTEIMSTPAILSKISNVDIFDISLSTTESVQILNKLDSSYSSPVLNDLQSTLTDHWNVFQIPKSHIPKEIVSKQTPQDTSTSDASIGRFDFRSSSRSSIIRLETTTSNSAMLSNVFQTSTDVHYSTKNLQNMTGANPSTTEENLINIEPSTTLKNSVMDSEMNRHTSLGFFIPNSSILSLFIPRLSTSMGEHLYASTASRQSIHDSKNIVTSTIDVDKHISERNSLVRSQFTSVSVSYIINTSITESSQSFTKTNVSLLDTTYENSILSNKVDPSSFQNTSEFSFPIDASDVSGVKFFTTSSNYDLAIPQTILSSLLSSLDFETTFTPDHVYSSLTLSRTHTFNVETTLTSLDRLSSRTEKMSATVLPVSSIIGQEQKSFTSSWYNYSTPSSVQVQQGGGISHFDIIPISVSAILSGSIKEFDTTRSAFTVEMHSPTVKIYTIPTSEQTETEKHEIESNLRFSKEQEIFSSTSLEIKPSSPVFDTSSSSILVFLFPETNLLVVEINVKPEIDVSKDDFKSSLEEDLTAVYIEGLHGRRKRNSINDSTGRVQDTGITVKIREINRKFEERVEIIFLVMYNGIVVHASLAELTFQKVSDVEMSAILGYPVMVSVSRWNSRSTSPSSPGGWGDIFQPLVIVLITLPTSIVLIATIIAIVKQCRSKSIHKHPSIPSQMDSLYKHNLVVDVENGDVRNRRISYEYPSDDEFSMASSDVFNEIKSKYSQSMHSKIKNFEKHNVKNHFHNQVERKASDALTNKVKFSISAEDSKSTCVKTDSNESNDSGVSSDGQKSPGEGPEIPRMSESVSHITNANVPQSVKQQNNLQIPPRNIHLQNPYPVKKKTNIKNLNSERVTSWVFMGDNPDVANNHVHHRISEGCRTNDKILESDTVAQVSHNFNHIPSMCDFECQTSDQDSNLGIQDHIYETLNRNDSVKEKKTEQSSMTQTESGSNGSDGFEYLEPLRQLLMAVEQQRRRNPPVSQFLQEGNVLQRCIHGFCNMGHCHTNCSPVGVPSRYGDVRVEDTGECAEECNCETQTVSHEKLSTPISVKQAQETRASTEPVCNERQLVTEQLKQSKDQLSRPNVLSNTKEACIYDQPEFSLVGFANSAEI
ncbi:serine-rich adhesin for platelets-like [Saccostrea echinata]|uniref:serine-rich adhesin for platelets-like n=1 Tax=Saccostrea echinata TaxID=191078 RepID=UPI002A812500|nr:serine-rich adhesin for platelets-like [Saccostrea echinata]